MVADSNAVEDRRRKMEAIRRGTGPVTTGSRFFVVFAALILDSFPVFF
jgi:hypothetical protein